MSLPWPDKIALRLVSYCPGKVSHILLLAPKCQLCGCKMKFKFPRTSICQTDKD